MSTEQATLLEQGSKRRGRKSGQSSQLPTHLRLAERASRNPMQRLLELASSVLQEAELLARDKIFAEQASKLRSLDLAGGIDFYAEVTEFETRLIKLALEQTHGNQAKAAELLRIKPTTLNSKIKLYKIECRG
ncbi:MAG TPA: helix-turn-helix domain-containing protein [Pyrinomonadaceae bacterium]